MVSSRYQRQETSPVVEIGTIAVSLSISIICEVISFNDTAKFNEKCSHNHHIFSMLLEYALKKSDVGLRKDLENMI